MQADQPMRHRTVGLGTGALILCTGTFGCAAQDPGAAGPAETTETSQEPTATNIASPAEPDPAELEEGDRIDPSQTAFATFDDDGDDAPQALLEGELTVKEGCVVVESSTGEMVLPLFGDSQVESHEQELLLGGEPATVGMEVSWGGGGPAGQEVDELTENFPQECAELSDQVFMAFTITP